jgi:hypothetical protein
LTLAAPAQTFAGMDQQNDQLEEIKARALQFAGAPREISTWEWVPSSVPDVRALMYDYRPLAGVRVVTSRGDALVAWDAVKHIVRYCTVSS